MATWDRLPRETNKQWEAFCLYRDMGNTRSVDGAFCQARGLQGDCKKRATKRWFTWSSDNQWVERATAYGDYLELLARQKRETEHLEEIAAYQSEMSKISKATLNNARGMLQLANGRLKIMTDSKGKDRSVQNLSNKDIVSFTRAANDSIEKAMSAWAQAIGIDKLMDMLKDIENE